jgi:hypothetical protein
MDYRKPHLEQMKNLDFYSKLKEGEKIYMIDSEKYKYDSSSWFMLDISRIKKLVYSSYYTIDMCIDKIFEEMNQVQQAFDEYKNFSYGEEFLNLYKRALDGFINLKNTYEKESRSIVQINIIIEDMKKKLSLHDNKSIIEEEPKEELKEDFFNSSQEKKTRSKKINNNIM